MKRVVGGNTFGYVAAILGVALGCGSGSARSTGAGGGGAPAGTGGSPAGGGGGAGGTDADAGADTGPDGSADAGLDAASCVPGDSPYGVNASDDADQLALARGAGFTWHRTSSMWMYSEWNPGQPDWSTDDANVAAHRSAGLQMLDQLPVSARWSCGRCYQGGAQLCTDCAWWEVAAPTGDPRTSVVYQFVYALVTELESRFPDYKVRAFEGYNEIDQTWNDTAAPAGGAGYYADYMAYYSDYVKGTMQPLYLAVHDACQAAGVDGCVVLGPTLGTVDWESRNGEAHQAFADLDAFDWIDVYDYHPYQGWGSCDPSALAAEVDHEGMWLQGLHVTKHLWITETGIAVCRGVNTSNSCVGSDDSERIDYLSLAMGFVSTRNWIDKVFLYDLVDAPGGCATADNGWGLYDDDLVARPALAAVAQIAGGWTCGP